MWYLLGEDYYVTDPICTEQCNTVVVADILTTMKGKDGYADLDKISQKEVA
jgi:hypothetical protein